MSKGGNKRARAVCVRAYKLSMDGYTHRQIAELIGCRVEQVPGKVLAGRRAFALNEWKREQEVRA